MGKLSKKLISIITAAVIVSGLTLTSIPAYEANAATNTSNTKGYDNGVLQVLNEDKVETYAASSYGLTDNIKDGTILHAWCWSFNTIKDNLKDIAEAGYSTVQTSPANECLVGDGGGMDLMGNGKWYYHYQPTDWKLGNYQLGSREEFKAMCAEAEKYGIKIIVDVLPNHTTPTLNAVAQSMKDAAGGQSNLYHANGFNEITDNGWNDRYWCTTGQMGGLPDVNTENPGFQAYYMNYVNDVIDCGGDGFRYDTAKHIGLPSDPLDAKSPRNNFWPVASGKESVNGVTLKDKDRVFIYGEVLQDANVKEGEYAQYMSLTASNYGGALRGAIGSKDFSVGRISNWSHSVTPTKLVTWVESHDTYCNHHESAGLSDWQIKMAWAIIAARKDGTPLFFSRPAGSSPGNVWGNNKIGVKGNDAFKDPEVAAVNNFRNAMVGQEEYMRNINGNSQILSIERGNKGQVIINLGGATDINTDTKLANGTYTDVVSGGTFTVSGGKLSGKLQGGKITVLYDAKPIVVGPSVTATPGTSSFKGNSIEVTLAAANCNSSTYKIGSGSAVAYTNGTKVTIGENLAPGESVTLTVSGSGAEGKSDTQTYTYTKLDSTVKEGYLYANKPSGWGELYAYVYDESSSPAKALAVWPGTKMIAAGEEFQLELPSEWRKATTRVIFTDGNNQFPASKQPGELFVPGKAMSFSNGAITAVEPTTVTTPLKLDSSALTLSSSSVEVGTKVSITTAAATGGSGAIQYQFDVDGQVINTYSASMSATWTPTIAGTYTVKVTAKDSKGATASASKTVTVTKTEEVKDLVISSKNVSLLSPQKVGTSIVLSMNTLNAQGNVKYRFVAITSGGKKTFAQSYSTNNTAVWTPSEAGTYTLYFKAIDDRNKEVNGNMTFVVTADNVEITSTTTSVASPQNTGTSITLSTKATGGSGTLKYRFVAMKGAVKTFAQSYSTKSTATWKPTEAGTYTLYFKVIDGTGKEVEKRVTYVIKSNTLTVQSYKTNVVSPAEVDTAITLSTEAAGGTGTLKYRFVAMKDGKTKTFAQDYSTKSTATWTPDEEGTYVLHFKVKDGAGKETYKTMTYVVKEKKYVNITSVTTSVASPQVLGTSVKITADATSLRGNNIQYKFLVHEGVTGWKTIKNYSTTNNATWKSASKGVCNIMVEAVDEFGYRDIKIVQYTIK